MPVRVEIGPRDLAAGSATLVRRIIGTKEPTPLAGIVGVVSDALAADQEQLYAEALTRSEDRTTDVASLDEAVEASAAGWARLPWSLLTDGGEDRLAAAGITVRLLARADGSVPDADDEPDLIASVARSY